MTVGTNRGDYYFSAGVSAVKDRIRQAGCCIDYSFIQFESLKNLNLLSENDLQKHPIKNIVIVSSSMLLPLALYYQKNTDHVLAVFKDTFPVGKVIAELSMSAVYLNNYQSKRWCGHPTLTSREVALLNLFVSGYSISQLAVELSIPVKTVYSRLEYIKNKMRVRRLRNIIASPYPECNANPLF